MNQATHFTSKATHFTRKEVHFARKVRHIEGQHLESKRIQQGHTGLARVCLVELREINLAKHQHRGQPRGHKEIKKPPHGRQET